MKAHPFFRPIEWDLLYAKGIPPPFVPRTTQTSDTSNVDPDFLAEAPEETPLDDNALLQMAHNDGDFDNFTYVNEHNLSEIDHAAGN